MQKAPRGSKGAPGARQRLLTEIKRLGRRGRGCAHGTVEVADGPLCLAQVCRRGIIWRIALAVAGFTSELIVSLLFTHFPSISSSWLPAKAPA